MLLDYGLLPGGRISFFFGLNLRPRRDQVIIARSEPAARPPKLSVEILPVPQEMQNNEPLKSEDKRIDEPFFDMLRQHLAEAKPTGPVDADQNSYADVAGRIAKI
jgi:hypothetical protein